MQVHLRGNLRHQRLQNADHPLRGEELEDLPEFPQVLVLVFRHAQQRPEYGVVDSLVAHAFFLGIAPGAVEAGHEQPVVRVVPDPAPFAVRAFQPVEPCVTDVAVAHEHFQRHVFKQVVHVHVVQDVLEILRVVGGIAGLDLLDHGLERLVAGSVFAGSAALQHVHLVRLVQGQPLVLGHEIPVHPFPQVHVAPVYAVQVHRHRLPGLVDHRRPVGVQHPALESVQHPGPHAVVPAVPQHEALVFRVGSVLEQRRREGFRAEYALGPELHALLGHVQRVVAHQPESGVLAHHRVALQVIHLHVAGLVDSRVLHLPVYRVLEGQLARGFLDGVGPQGQHALLFVPQDSRIRHHRYHRQRMVYIHEVGPRDNVAGLQPRRGEGPRPDHRRVVDFQPFPVVGRRPRGGDAAVRRVIDLRALRNLQLQIHRGIMHSRLNAEGRRLRVSGEADAVGQKGGGFGIIKKARHSNGPTI